MQFFVVRVDAPPGVVIPGGCYVTVESGPHQGLTTALETLKNPKPRAHTLPDIVFLSTSTPVWAVDEIVSEKPRLVLSYATLREARDAAKAQRAAARLNGVRGVAAPTGLPHPDVIHSVRTWRRRRRRQMRGPGQGGSASDRSDSEGDADGRPQLKAEPSNMKQSGEENGSPLDAKPDFTRDLEAGEPVAQPAMYASPVPATAKQPQKQHGEPGMTTTTPTPVPFPPLSGGKAAPMVFMPWAMGMHPAYGMVPYQAMLMASQALAIGQRPPAGGLSPPLAAAMMVKTSPPAAAPAAGSVDDRSNGKIEAKVAEKEPEKVQEGGGSPLK